jgi:hypothetical protein
MKEFLPILLALDPDLFSKGADPDQKVQCGMDTWGLGSGILEHRYTHHSKYWTGTLKKLF